MRILLVTYYFPPFNSVGAVRPAKLARFLLDQGHDLHVLTCSNQPYPEGLPQEVPADRITATPAWSVNAPIDWLLGGREKVAREGYAGGAPKSKLVQAFSHVYRTLLHWPDSQRGWVGSALQAGRSLLAKEKFDLIFATGGPFSALKVGGTLARESGVPWVAELRDLWTDNQFYDYPRWRRALERRTEGGLLRSARALVTVSEPLARRLQRFGRPVWEVRNGCDPEDFANLGRPEEFGSDRNHLDIVFTGNVYPGHYDVQSFCEGLRLFVQQGGSATVHVAGRNTAALQQEARRCGLAGHFRFAATVPRAQALAMQKHADVLLFFIWATGNEGIYSLKLFEYAGAGRPVLAVGPMADVGRLVVDAGLGTVCTGASEVQAQLRVLLQDKQRQGELAQSLRPGFDLTRRAQFAKLQAHLVTLVEAR